MEGKTILVVDDVMVNVTLVKYILARESYKVLTANSGTECLQVVNSQAVDCVLLDIMMPGIDGYQTLNKIRETKTKEQLPVIMLSALNMHEDVQKALDMGANDYISKPVVKPKLLAALNKIFNG